MLRTVIVGAVVSLSLIGFTLAVPQCSGDCADGYCPTTCYTNEANLLCTCETRYGGLEVVCNKPDGSECDGISLQPEFTEEDCKTQSTDNADSHAYIFDTNLFGPRCRIITDCQTMEEAEVVVPCTDCISGRSCSSCPQLEYSAGTTSVHWICVSAVGDPYTHKMVEGTSCSVTHECDEVEVKTILCASGDGADGEWKDTTNNEGGEDMPEPPKDVSCNCKELRIPVAEDTNVFCDPNVDPTDGNYNLDANQKCDVVCDGSVFIPLSCKFDTGNQVAWHISYGGEDIALADDTTCFACSIDSCNDNGSTNKPGTTEAQETTASETPEPATSETPEPPTSEATQAPTSEPF